jgi:hypothetical protein
MKPLVLPVAKKSAKQFLIKLVPQLLRSCGVATEQSFFGFKVNIQAEATKRINGMAESEALWALDSLRELLKEW